MAHISFAAMPLRRTTVEAAVRGMRPDFFEKVAKAERILIKPDVGHFELQLAATHIDALRGLLDVLRSKTQVPIVIADAGHYGTLQGFRHFGFSQLLQEYPKLELHDLQVEPTREQRVSGLRADLTLQRAKDAVEAPLKISLATLKTHRVYGACLGIPSWVEGTWIVPPRNTVRGTVYSRSSWLEAEGNAGAHHLLAELYAEHPCDAVIIDGFLGMEGDGPVDGTPVHRGLALASDDPLAADAVAAMLMGIDPESLTYLSLLAKKGLGEIRPLFLEGVPLQTLHEHVHAFSLPYEQRHLRSS